MEQTSTKVADHLGQFTKKIAAKNELILTPKQQKSSIQKQKSAKN